MIENYQNPNENENENKQDFQQNVNNSSMPQNPQTIIIRQEEKSTNGIGTAGFIMSLIAIFLGWIPFSVGDLCYTILIFFILELPQLLVILFLPKILTLHHHR